MNASLWSRENIAWLAGLLEGEGCFQIINGTSPQIVLNMTDEDIVVRAREIAGVGHINGPRVFKNPKHSPIFRWRVSNAEHAYAVMVAILPFMGKRRTAKIELAMEAFRKSGPFMARIHGTKERYKRGCRCDMCKRAWGMYLKTGQTRIAA